MGSDKFKPDEKDSFEKIFTSFHATRAERVFMRAVHTLHSLQVKMR